MVKVVSISQQGFRRLFDDWFDAKHTNPSFDQWVRTELGAVYRQELTNIINGHYQVTWHFTFEREQEALLFVLRYS
jgi:hypothetical protein